MRHYLEGTIRSQAGEILNLRRATSMSLRTAFVRVELNSAQVLHTIE